jgi:hypothetical protein
MAGGHSDVSSRRGMLSRNRRDGRLFNEIVFGAECLGRRFVVGDLDHQLPLR